MTNTNSPHLFSHPNIIPYNSIFNYHSPNRPFVYFVDTQHPTGSEKEGVLYLGVEVEFDTSKSQAARLSNKHELINISNEIFGNNTFAYYMRDGSLSKGLELITQPATFNAHEALEDKYRQLFAAIKDHGFGSDRFQTCGYHIHFNRSYFSDNPDLYTMNLLYLVEKFWRDLVLLSRRDYDRIVRWANRYNDTPEKVVNEAKNGLHHFDRYHAVNLTNANTIEFRIYKGTLDVEKFLATMELTRNLVVAAKTKSPCELQSMQFSELITSGRLQKFSQTCHTKKAEEKLPYFLK